MAFESVAAPHPDDTIVALSSAEGGALRAIIRVSGPKTRAVVDRVFQASGGREPPDPEPDVPSARQIGGLKLLARHLQPGQVRLSSIHSPLPADLYYFASPHSYTGQDLAELHTIGSPPLVERLIADLLAAGARPANPGEFTLRAFLAGKLDLAQAEAVHAVIEAGTDLDLKRALTQLAGGVTRPAEATRDDLLNLLADLEAGLDFADEDIEFVPKADALARIAAALARLETLRQQLDDRGVSGRPFRVALVGLPNAGKSSLFNALGSGIEAIVSPVPGTTRDYLTKRLTLGEVPVELIDTAGREEVSTTIEVQAQHLGREQAEQADLVLWCVEPGADFAEAFGPNCLRVRTKSDLQCDASFDAIATSTITPGGTTALLSLLTERAQHFARPSLAPSQSRCRHHVEACLADLREAHGLIATDAPQELAALSLRAALGQLGEMVGAVYTNNLLDRIFSRFCIGK